MMKHRQIKSKVLAFLLVCIPFSMLEQTSQQGFFLDSWIPKTIEITDFDNFEQTSSPSTVTITVDAGNVLNKVSKYVYGHNVAAWGGKLIRMHKR